MKRDVASSHSTPYHPIGNSQVERYNGILWKATRLALKSHNVPADSWEAVLPDALHSIRLLLCTSTNATPHELFFVLIGGLRMGNRCLHGCLGLAQCF